MSSVDENEAKSDDAMKMRRMRITKAIQRNEELVKDLKHMSGELLKAVKEGNMAKTEVYIKENVDLYKEVVRKVRSVHETLRSAIDLNGDGVIDEKDCACCIGCS